uniref:hypothetical protein n=1 Tax=Serratia quinivorans TaxID=137545 RepID=UPI0035C76BC4
MLAWKVATISAGTALPIKICQVVSGGDYGWRSGSGKWPDYYEDSLPSTIDIGPGSPTGVL